MAIVQLDKLTLYGIGRQRDAVLAGLQRLGCMHLVNLQEKEPKSAERPERSDVHEAIKYLAACSVQRGAPTTRKGYDCLQVTREALEIKRRRQALHDEHDELSRSVRTLEPWGDFRLPTERELGRLQFWFYPLRHHQVGHVETRADLSWKVVAADREHVYVVVVAAEEPQDMPANPVELDPRPLSQLKARLEQVEIELEESDLRRVKLTRWSAFLSQDLDEADDEAARMEAVHRLLGDQDLFALQGWVPRSTVEHVRAFARKHRLAVQIEEPGPDEKPPTLLNNPKQIAGAEGAVTFYITPDYRTWDPTLVVFFSFSLFFAMIMSDAGYGLVLAALLVFVLWRKLGGSEAGRRFRNLLVGVLVATVAYGVLIGSYFGVNPADVSWLKWLDSLQLRINDKPMMAPENQGAMMGIAVTIGVLHLALANLITAWQNRRTSQCLGSVGWAAVFLGGLVLIASQMMDPNPLAGWLAGMLNRPYSDVQDAAVRGSAAALIGGFVAVFAFSSARPLLSVRISDWIWRILDGLQALTGVSKAFGDVLSYLRLFALGLASAQLAATFNDLAGGVREFRGIGILLALLILLVGHSINLLLAIVGGVVHGLRLNCIEFFSWSLKDEGYPFQAFCKKASG
jgi:V/A-type H+-transporting ATPase subunit I